MRTDKKNTRAINKSETRKDNMMAPCLLQRFCCNDTVHTIYPTGSMNSQGVAIDVGEITRRNDCAVGIIGTSFRVLMISDGEPDMSRAIRRLWHDTFAYRSAGGFR